jgi:hypothetical protein
MDVFQSPQKREDGSYMLEFVKPVELEVELRWEKDAEFPTPDLRIQSAINAFREKTLRDLVKNRVMFRTAPTLASLTSIAPTWGILLRGDTMEWSRQDIWSKKANGSLVTLVGTGVVLSRHSIVPVWGVKVSRSLPDAQIDFDFGGEEDGESVHSDDIEAEDGLVHLKDPVERKRQMKAYVRGLLEKASDAKMAADDAMDRFFSEFDLSEDESDFSDIE